MGDSTRGSGDGSRGRGTPGDGRGISGAGSSTGGVDRRHVLKTAAGGALGVSMAGCLDAIGTTARAEEDGPVRIGVLAPDPNRDPIGFSMRIGAELGAAHLNERFDELEFEVVVGDTKSRPLQARREYQRLLLEEKVDLTVGVYNSAALDNIVHDIARQKTVHITSGATSELPTRLMQEDYEKYKYHFRSTTSGTQLVTNQLQFVGQTFLQQFGWQSVAILAEDYQWAQGLTLAMQAGIDGMDHLQLVDVIQYPPETTDFGPLYERAEAAGADGMFTAMAHTGNDAIVDYAINRPSLGFAGIHVPMQIPAYYQMVGGACRYAITSTSAVPGLELSDTTEPFNEQFFDVAGTYPMHTGYTTYNGLLGYAAAIEAGANPADSDELVATLEEIEAPSTTGRVAFQHPDRWEGPEEDDPETFHLPHEPPWFPSDTEYVGSVFFQWQADADDNGVPVAIWPDRIATGEYEAPPWF